MGTEKINVKADLTELDHVLGFAEEVVMAAGCSMKMSMQLQLCLEEVFVNVANYAYVPDTGSCEIEIVAKEKAEDTPGTAVVTVKDWGKPFNPLEKADPDITLSADERQIGGLGIYMVKQSMSSVDYTYEEGANILTMTMHW